MEQAPVIMIWKQHNLTIQRHNMEQAQHIMTWWQQSITTQRHNMEQSQEKKEEICLSPMTKAPTPTEMSKGQSDNTNNATKQFDYTTHHNMNTT